jgi:hypothetical protein
MRESMLPRDRVSCALTKTEQVRILVGRAHAKAAVRLHKRSLCSYASLGVTRYEAQWMTTTLVLLRMGSRLWTQLSRYRIMRSLQLAVATDASIRGDQAKDGQLFVYTMHC